MMHLAEQRILLRERPAQFVFDLLLPPDVSRHPDLAMTPTGTIVQVRLRAGNRQRRAAPPHHLGTSRSLGIAPNQRTDVPADELALAPAELLDRGTVHPAHTAAQIGHDQDVV